MITTSYRHLTIVTVVVIGSFLCVSNFIILYKLDEDHSQLLTTSSAELSNIDNHEKFPLLVPFYNCSNEFFAAPQGLGITYDVSLFYHVGMIKNWRDIMQEQLSLVERCGLGSIAYTMTISFSVPAGKSTVESAVQDVQEILTQYSFASRMKINFIGPSLEIPFERPILEAATMSCRNTDSNKTSIVFYFHSKGSSKYEDYQSKKEEYEAYINIYHWRRFMEWFLLERPTLCIRAILNHGTYTCGVNLQKEPSMHYSGNFWMASCSYVRDLPIAASWPSTDNSDDWTKYVQAEMWIGNFSKSRAESDVLRYLTLFNIRGNLYFYRAVEDSYAWVIRDQTFLSLNQSSEYYDPWPRLAQYETGNQTAIWLDYLLGFRTV